MFSSTSQPPTPWYPEDDRAYYSRSDRDMTRSGTSLLIVGLAAVGLGVLAWRYLGPDFRRYMKIRSM